MASTSAVKDILVIGSLNADIIIETTRLPKRGETIATPNDRTGYMLPGGKGANQATAVAKASLSEEKKILTRARLATVFGNDGHVEKLQDTLKSNNVDISLCLQSNVPSGQAFIFLEPGGENSIIIVGGSNNSWPETLPKKIQDAIKSAACVLLQQEIPERVNLAVAKCAQAFGVEVMMDLGGEERKMSKEILSCVTIVSPNETELARATGLPTDTKEKCVKAARKLIEKGCKQILVTLGEHGVLLVSDNVLLLYTDTYTYIMLTHTQTCVSDNVLRLFYTDTYTYIMLTHTQTCVSDNVLHRYVYIHNTYTHTNLCF
ncbi:hypothetical protein AAMO2058_000061500 [Amorphochlora amoebiformis]